MEGGKYNFAIDRGGTFTDVLCITPDRTVRTLKLLSVDPANYPDAPTEGIRRILQQETGRALTVDGLIDTGLIGWVRMGTTVATNALLERAGDPVALVVNRGFRDLLQIGNQARPNIFQLVSMGRGAASVRIVIYIFVCIIMHFSWTASMARIESI